MARIQLQTNTLQRKIETWQEIQILYMPFVSRLRAGEEASRTSSQPLQIQDVKLWLPSNVGTYTPCPECLRQFEWKLRNAQANDALKDIHHLLRLRSHLYHFKDTNVVGQGANTRARNTINKTEAKISGAAARYEAARNSIISLAPILGETDWRKVFRPLDRNKDLKSLKDLWEKETEGTRRLSWIWLTPGVSDDIDAGLHDGMSQRDCVRVKF
jgi:hypothetical protein